MRFWKIGALALSLGLASPAFAQEPGLTTSDDLVVTADRLQEVVRAFVGEVSSTSSSEDQLARWDRRICPSLIGIRNRAQAQQVIDRIAARTFEVDLDVGEPNCRANVLIFVTPDSTTLARAIADQYRELIGYRSDQADVTRGHEALTDFVGTPRPVRWWHVSQTVTADGQVLGNAQTQMTRSGGFRGAQVARGYDAGRLRSTTRQDFSRVIIIVDAQQAAGKPLDAIADYVAMVALAQLDPSADTSEFSTILNLFADPTVNGMTEWDRNYLEGLYGAPRTARNSRQQQGSIARSMQEGLRDQPQQPPSQ